MHVLKQLMNYWIHLTILILRKKKPHNALLSVISEILNLKVSNVDIAWSQHDNNKDVETDSSFFFITLLNLSENYFHKSQTNKCHGNVNGGKYPHIKCWCEWHDISAFQILHTRHTILCSSCGGNLGAQFTDQPDLKRYTVLCKQARVNSRLRHF